MDQTDRENLVALRRCAERKEAEHYALVLSAMGVPSLIAPDGGLSTLYVKPADAERAAEELASYERENPKTRPAPPPVRQPLPPLETAFAYWAVLLVFFAAARSEAFSVDWAGAGAVRPELMFKGEWWRAVTALTLHVDTAHILSNLVFGTVFLLLLAQVTGPGLAWLCVVAAGTAGNVLNALLQAPTHNSIGASTAIFASLGLLAALRQKQPTERKLLAWLRTWAPLGGGLALLGLLGFSGGNTDIGAHVLGFAAGLVLGWGPARHRRDWPADRELQRKSALGAAGIIALAWGLALA